MLLTPRFLLCFWSALLSKAVAQDVFAHVIVGNTCSYTVDQWTSDIQLAASYGIDGFALNIAPPYSGCTASQISNSFAAAGQLQSSFSLFFSFDFQGGGYPWDQADIVTILQQYGGNAAHFKVDNKPFVSTFEGDSSFDSTWNSIRSSVASNIYFVPDWTSQAPGGFSADLVDGAFSWDMWPEGANNISTDSDIAWKNNWADPNGKSYMMGVSPWFFTDLPGYHKAFVWRGDDMWYERWEQAKQILPRFVEIVTWNDFGESHYIGPIVPSGIPSGSNSIGSTDATWYVNGYPHQAWLETLPYQIADYKHAYDTANPAPTVAPGGDKIVFWYRTSPASAGTTDATGNNCQSPINIYGYQPCAAVADVLEDAVFAIILASAPGTATVTIGTGPPATFSGLQPGINFVSAPFDGQEGQVQLTFNDLTGSGAEITSNPTDGRANFNSWVGCVGSCS